MKSKSSTALSRGSRSAASAAAGRGRLIVSHTRIARRVRELAGEIDRCYRGQELSLVVVLTGAMVFAADLVRRLRTPLRIWTVEASSYPGKATRSRGTVELGRMPRALSGRNVLVVDDILDSGVTLRQIVQRLRRRRPGSLRTCVLLRKRRQETAFNADWVGFDVPDTFVVGYGLDYDGRLRNLPDVRALPAVHRKDQP